MKKEKEGKKRGKIAEELLERFQSEWEERKKKEAEELHNDLAEVISEHQSDIYTLLFVLEMLKFEALQDKHAKLFGSEPEIKLSDKEPVPITGPAVPAENI